MSRTFTGQCAECTVEATIELCLFWDICMPVSWLFIKLCPPLLSDGSWIELCQLAWHWITHCWDLGMCARLLCEPLQPTIAHNALLCEDSEETFTCTVCLQRSKFNLTHRQIKLPKSNIVDLNLKHLIISWVIGCLYCQRSKHWRVFHF